MSPGAPYKIYLFDKLISPIPKGDKSDLLISYLSAIY